jgi:hypothetical protein
MPCSAAVGWHACRFRCSAFRRPSSRAIRTRTLWFGADLCGEAYFPFLPGARLLADGARSGVRCNFSPASASLPTVHIWGRGGYSVQATLLTCGKLELPLQSSSSSALPQWSWDCISGIASDWRMSGKHDSVTLAENHVYTARAAQISYHGVLPGTQSHHVSDAAMPGRSAGHSPGKPPRRTEVFRIAARCRQCDIRMRRFWIHDIQAAEDQGGVAAGGPSPAAVAKTPAGCVDGLKKIAMENGGRFIRVVDDEGGPER